MAKDYYQILGINKNASAEEIRRAFRELAQKHHPDKGGDAEKFKGVNEAYQVLSNPEKRGQYDQYGETFEQARSRGGFSGFEGFGDFATWAQGMGASDLGDILNQMFGGGFGFGGASRGRRVSRGEDLELTIDITLSDAVLGANKNITLARLERCDVCKASGAKPGTKTITCKSCKGEGQVVHQQRTFFGTFQSVVACRDCRGEGSRFEHSCPACRGDGRLRQDKKLEIAIPQGVQTGMTLRLRGQGNAGERGAESGDTYVHINLVIPHRLTKEQKRLLEELRGAGL